MQVEQLTSDDGGVAWAMSRMQEAEATASECRAKMEAAGAAAAAAAGAEAAALQELEELRQVTYDVC
jgi:hypothetical protein